MKRNIVLGFLCFFLLFSGCQAIKTESKTTLQDAYVGYYTSIVDNTKFKGSSVYYTLSAEMSALPDGTYRYYIFLDEPQIAMYDIVMMSVEDNIPYENSTKMMPSIGIFDSKGYSMLPNQVYTEGGYVKGLMMSGECSSPKVLLKIMVEWSDKSRENVSREFFSYELTMDGFTHPEDSPTSEGTPQP